MQRAVIAMARGSAPGEMVRGEDVWLSAKNFYQSFLALSAVRLLESVANVLLMCC